MRFERMTYGLEGSCSIQLSYECIKESGWDEFLFSSRFLLRGVGLGLARWAERIWPPSGARAERGRMERGAAKWRGRGLGQRDTNKHLISKEQKTYNLKIKTFTSNKIYGK